MVITKIDSFAVLYSANTFAPRIWLLAKGNYIGQLVFERDNTPLPPDSQVGGQVNLFYHLEQFPHALNLLESDSPVSLLWAGTGAGNENALLTAPENVTSEQINAMLKHP
jgi:hypothetical protein